MKDVSNRKRLLANFSSLFTVKIAQYVIPLITVPYLVRVLGPERYGLVVFSQAFVTYFMLVSNYGFNHSATREISIFRQDIPKCSTIFSSVMFIKLILMPVLFAVMMAIVMSIDKFRVNAYIYIVTFGMLVGNVMFPLWLFQGFEKMKEIAALNIVSRLIYAISIFAMVKESADYLLVPLLNSISYIVIGLASIYFIIKKIGLKIRIPKWYDIKFELKEGWYIFVSSIATSIYTISSTFILGLMTNNVLVGYYSAGDSIIKAFLGLNEPIGQTVYPYVSKLANTSKVAAHRFLMKLFKFIVIPNLLVSVVIFATAPHISRIILGSQYEGSIVIIRSMAFLPFVVTLSGLFGTQGVTAFGYYSVVTKILGVSAIIHLAMVFFMTKYFSYVGTALSLLTTESIIALLMMISYFRVCCHNTSECSSHLQRCEVPV